jgi:hypothetical protein
MAIITNYCRKNIFLFSFFFCFENSHSLIKRHYCDCQVLVTNRIEAMVPLSDPNNVHCSLELSFFFFSTEQLASKRMDND